MGKTDRSNSSQAPLGLRISMSIKQNGSDCGRHTGNLYIITLYTDFSDTSLALF
jgi:hypothetical protein